MGTHPVPCQDLNLCPSVPAAYLTELLRLDHDVEFLTFHTKKRSRRRKLNRDVVVLKLLLGPTPGLEPRATTVWSKPLYSRLIPVNPTELYWVSP